MVVPTCSKCGQEIGSDNINVANDVAYCRDCNLSYRLSELTCDEVSTVVFDFDHPPKGAWFAIDRDATVIGATNRNPANAAGFLFFALFWNGILSIFLLFAAAAGLRHLGISLPVWFPAPRMDGEDMSVGMTIFLWVFLMPFVLVGLFVAGAALSSLFGRTEVRINEVEATVFTGIGALGWRRRFDPSQVKDIRTHRKHNSEGNDTLTILVETREGKQIKLGSLLSNERRQFVLAALRKRLQG
jgi:hypothetical protein